MKPIITIHDASTNETVEREMTDIELVEFNKYLETVVIPIPHEENS